ncbi:MAG: LuxR C-terminal-related transcriptional regulator [Lachnospiraceae bacterium]|nr:LuxR C-terminal-related transcriptional regulator [Lachnospiraceae bacterium]
MEKNEFLLINDLVYQLHTAPSLTQVETIFLNRLKSIIPYSYASIFTTCEKDGRILLKNPVCIPSSFAKVEQKYLELENAEELDQTNWILYSTETALIRESELIDDRHRLSSPVYRKVYSHYNIFDTLQMSIIYDKVAYGVVTLYRTKEMGTFTADERIFLRAFSKHLNYIFYRHISSPQDHNRSERIAELAASYHLTRREQEILGYIFDGQNNQEILEELPITEHTLQKHIQNLYRKFNVSTRWDLLKFK